MNRYGRALDLIVLIISNFLFFFNFFSFFLSLPVRMWYNKKESKDIDSDRAE